ncbi:MAG: SBBP repeat-containing protein [Desulfobacteraceae bacterium]|nr:SBBP repeat-containing protein [Desulfobacteraceae bacterium]
MFTKFRILYLSAVILLTTVIFTVYLQAASLQIKPANFQKTHEILQFTNSGHVLGFQPNSVYVASGIHILRENFIGTNGAVFQTDQEVTEDGRSQPMSTVSYPELWEGITLTYDSPPGGILRSTYQIKPEADPGKITLRYNVPVYLDTFGNLIFKFKTGTMTASAPIAWQTIRGECVMVDVAFILDNLQSTVSFSLGNYNSAFPLTIDPTLTWHTFMGSTGNDYGNAIAVDDTGNIYVAGTSEATWGSSPVIGHAGGGDAFVAKLNSSGELQWNTFMGSAGGDHGKAIAVDSSGNIYVAGYSSATWGITPNPVIDHVGGNDAFVIKLNNSGVRQWNTFMGSAGSDEGHGIAVDGAGNVYVAGYSTATWGSSPVNAYAGNYEVFVAKLDNNGVRLWNTFMGSAGYDYFSAIAVDGSSNVYVAGSSTATWGSLPDPVNAHAGGDDGFAVKLNTSGVRQWNTFMGSGLANSSDASSGIAVDSKGNVYVSGSSEDTWGSPVSAFVSLWGSDIFVARLNNSGSLQWNTFIGSYAVDYSKTIVLDSIGDIYITGFSNKTWGSPINPHAGGVGDPYDAIAAKLNTSGVLQWNTFMGSTDVDRGRGIAVDKRKNVYVTGYSQANWGGCPLNSYEGADEAFVVKILQGSLTPGIPMLLLLD